MTHQKRDPSRNKTNNLFSKERSLDKASKDSVQEGFDLLEKQRPINFATIKESCLFEIDRFIRMRGTIDSSTGHVHLPFMSVSIQNSAATIKKIKAANDLRINIEATASIEDINNTLKNASPSRLRDDLTALINKCLLISGLHCHP